MYQWRFTFRHRSSKKNMFMVRHRAPRRRGKKSNFRKTQRGKKFRRREKVQKKREKVPKKWGKVQKKTEKVQKKREKVQKKRVRVQKKRGKVKKKRKQVEQVELNKVKIQIPCSQKK